MAQSRTIPADPLEFIRRCVQERKIFWTYHVNMRLKRRSISRAAVLDSVKSYEVIEEYPDDKYLPSYLVFAEAGEEQIHILFATDVAGDNVRIVTAYRPDPREWWPDLRTRRTQ